jgi:hypothetical protein
MSARQIDEFHHHATMAAYVLPEYAENGRLHRHRVPSDDGSRRYTTWAHNTRNHAHRLPNGAWTRPRRDLHPPQPVEATVW